MHPVGKTLWYIETHLSEDLTVDAGVAEVSGYHLVRSFGTVTGLPLMHYVRYRRLSKAAVELTASDLRILEIAMNAGYNSHEAFTRAFVACFGVSPETLRNANNLQDLKLVEPTKMNDLPLEKIPEPRMVNSKPLIIAGLRSAANRPGFTFAPLVAAWRIGGHCRLTMRGDNASRLICG